MHNSNMCSEVQLCVDIKPLPSILDAVQEHLAAHNPNACSESQLCLDISKEASSANLDAVIAK